MMAQTNSAQTNPAQTNPPPMTLDMLIAAGLRLAEALRAENEALSALDLARAAGLTDAKIAASDAFAAAFATAARGNARAEGPMRQTAADLTTRLEALGAENRWLLERAIAVQSRVIETIAGAALPRPTGAGYGAAGRQPAPRQPRALAVATRA